MPKFLISISSLFSFFLLWNCASQTTPMGGPKDEDPPLLVQSTPIHKQRNFNGKSIELLFNEPVNLFSPKDEILISPSPGKVITYKVKKNTVTITPTNGWEENTTYSVSFREGIKDITENNAPKNLKLAFSTGPLIDSLTIPGKIKLVSKETIPENITVALYKSDTFNIFQHTPTYFTISTNTGEFSLENIKDGTYYIYAFSDKNKNLKVDSRTEKYGFLSKPIVLNGPTDSLTIPLVSLDSRELSINNIRNNGLYTRVKFNKSLKEYSLYKTSPVEVINSYGDDKTEITLYNPNAIKDSLLVAISALDSIESRIDTSFYLKSFEPKFIPGDFTVKANNPKYNLEKSTVIHKLSLSKPLTTINLDSIFIQIDSTSSIKVEKDALRYDSISKTLFMEITVPPDSLFKTIETTQIDTVASKSEPNQTQLRSRTTSKKTKPQLILGYGALISIEGDSSKLRAFEIPYIEKASTGTLLIQALTNKPHYVIQLYNSGGELLEEIRNKTSHTFHYLPAQNYRLKVIVDDNNNGVWDIGNIFKQVEPEPIFIYKTADNKYEFPIRANWELGPLMLIF